MNIYICPNTQKEEVVNHTKENFLIAEEILIREKLEKRIELKIIEGVLEQKEIYASTGG
jgi:hypothetical protein